MNAKDARKYIAAKCELLHVNATRYDGRYKITGESDYFSDYVFCGGVHDTAAYLQGLSTRLSADMIHTPVALRVYAARAGAAIYDAGDVVYRLQWYVNETLRADMRDTWQQSQYIGDRLYELSSKLPDMPRRGNAYDGDAHIEQREKIAAALNDALKELNTAYARVYELMKGLE